MYGENSKKLVKELKTSKWLPPYNHALIEQITKETLMIYEKASEDMSYRKDTHSISILLSAMTTKRNIRGVLAYLNYRLQKLEELRWETGPKIPPHFQNQLSKHEIEYFQGYSALLNSYSKSISKTLKLDLTADKQPPKSLYVEGRVMEDMGEVVLPDTGAVNLKKNTTHLFRRTEAYHLIKQGIVKQVN